MTPGQPQPKKDFDIPFQVIGPDSLPHELNGFLDADGLGRLRRELIWTIGEEPARGVLVRMGLSRGQADYLQTQQETPPFMPGLGNLQRIADPQAPQLITFDVHNTAEAHQHQHYFGPSRQPQCWLIAGYLTGYYRFLLEGPLYFLETSVVQHLSD